jgi:hypothetical protein
MIGVRLPRSARAWYSPGTGGRTTPPSGARWIRDGSAVGGGSVSSPTGAVPLRVCAWLPSDGGLASVAGHNARSSGQAATVTPKYSGVRFRPSGLVRRRLTDNCMRARCIRDSLRPATEQSAAAQLDVTNMNGLGLQRSNRAWYPGTGERVAPPSGTRWFRGGSGLRVGSASSPTEAAPLRECAWLPPDGGPAAVARQDARSSGQAATVTSEDRSVRFRPSGLVRRRIETPCAP